MTLTVPIETEQWIGYRPMSKACPGCGSASERVRNDKFKFLIDSRRCRLTTRVYSNAASPDLDRRGDDR